MSTRRRPSSSGTDQRLAHRSVHRSYKLKGPGSGLSRRHRHGRQPRSVTGHDPRTSSVRAATASAICAAFRAAPLRRLSPQTNSSSARADRPASAAPGPPRWGRCRPRPRAWGSRRRPGRRRARRRARSPGSRGPAPTVTSLSKRACTDTECVVTTGTRTQVAATGSRGRSEDLARSRRGSPAPARTSRPRPSSPAQGTTFSATGAANGPSAVAHGAAHIAGAACPVRYRRRATICRRSASTPACPAPLTAWYVETTSSLRPNSACSAPTATIMRGWCSAGSATMPRGRIRTACGIELGDHERHVRVHPEGGGAVHDHRALGGRDRRPLGGDRRRGRGTRATSTPSRASSLRREDLALLARARASLRAGRARGGDEADLAPDVGVLRTGSGA